MVTVEVSLYTYSWPVRKQNKMIGEETGRHEFLNLNARVYLNKYDHSVIQPAIAQWAQAFKPELHRIDELIRDIGLLPVPRNKRFY